MRRLEKAEDMFKVLTGARPVAFPSQGLFLYTDVALVNCEGGLLAEDIMSTVCWHRSRLVSDA